MKKVVSKEYLIKDLGLPDNSSIILEEKVIDHQKGITVYELIFRDLDKIWSVEYGTDGEWISPWEYEDEVTLTEVELVETVKREYVKVSDEE